MIQCVGIPKGSIRNFASFLGHFEVGTRTMRRSSELVQNEKIELV